MLLRGVEFVLSHLEPFDHAAREDVFGCEEVDSTVQPFCVVERDIVGNHTAGIIEIKQRLLPETLFGEGPVPAFKLAVALRMVHGGAHVLEAFLAHELGEVLGDELRAVVADHPRVRVGIALQRPGDRDLDVALLHREPEFVMDDVARVTVDDRDQEQERAVEVDVLDVHMPVLVDPERLVEAPLFQGFSCIPAGEQSRCLEHAVGGRRAHGDDILIEHHIRQGTIAFHGVVLPIADDRFPLPRQDPRESGGRAVVMVGLSETFAPLVVLVLFQAEPREDPLQADPRAAGDGLDVAHDGVPDVRLNPESVHFMPFDLFFNVMLSCTRSAMSASFSCSCF